MTHTYLIAEDEPLLARALAKQLKEHWGAADCVGVAENGDQALELIEQHQPDVVFLDIRMPERDGLEVARELCAQEKPPLVVFVTAYDAYALQAFDTAAIDYLLKPIDNARLTRCIERIKNRLAGDRHESAGELAHQLTKLLAKNQNANERLRLIKASAGQTVRLIPVDEVLWFEAADKYLTVATCDGDSVIRMPLRELIQQLDPEVFWQVHRGTVVNSRHVLAAKRDELGHVTLVIRGRKEELPVSRQFAQLFKQM